jgi:general secretion pathway protein J
MAHFAADLTATCHAVIQPLDDTLLPDQTGFTLLEMLVAVTLLAIFAVALAGALRFGIRAEDHVSGTVFTEGRFARAESFLRERIGHAEPIWIPSTGRGHVAFRGDQTSMEFWAPTPQSLGGIGFIQYKLTTGQSTRALRLLSQVVQQATDGRAEPLASTVLLDDVSELHFSYFGRMDKGEGSTWQQAWIDRTTLPQLIAVQAQSRGWGAASHLRLVIHPRIDIDAACQLDAQTMSCIGR